MIIVISRKKIRHAYIGHCYRLRARYYALIGATLIAEFIVSHQP